MMSLNPERLTIAAYEEGVNKLVLGFRIAILTEETMKVYYSRINFVTDKEFLQAVDDILDKEQWFPSIKVLLDWLPAPKKWQPSFEELLS